jgi:AraC-like DNA-binding protein
MILDNSNIANEAGIRIGMGETKTLEYPFHYHLHHYELTYIEGEIGILLAGNVISSFENKCLMLIPPRIPHTWISYKNKELNPNSQYRFITIQFTLDYLTEGLLLRPEMANIRRLLVAAEKVAILNESQEDILVQNLFDLKLEPDFSTYIRILELLNAMGTVKSLGQLIRTNYDYRGNEKDSRLFSEVFKYILSNYTRRIKISSPAGILDLNDTAFSHYFKKRTGKSFTDFINRLRLHEADALIRSTSKKIARISQECGFNNLSNFNRIYKSWKKMAPADSRRHIISNQ